MCQFCTEHGEGRIWYLEAANHSREMMERLRVEERLRRHALNFEASTVRLFTIYDRLAPLWRIAPFRGLAHAWAVSRQKRRHFGQIVPLEHARRVLALAGSIVRLPCACRRFVKGRPEARYCLGLGFDPLKVYGGHPEYGGDFEMLSPDAAGALLENFERDEGLVHTVWTMPTPFVASVCNCSREECGAMIASYKVGIGVIFPGEMKAAVSPEDCGGCGACLDNCPFGVLRMDHSTGKATADTEHCRGCGVCRRSCARGAIVLMDPTGRTKAGERSGHDTGVSHP